MTFRNWISKVTHSERYSLVKIIAPAIYRAVEQTERGTVCFVRDSKGYTPLTGVEIGVWKGVNAESILKTLNMKKLYLVDPYEPYMQKNIPQTTIATEKGFPISFKRLKEISYNRLKKYRDRVEFIYKFSADAVGLIPNGLDFVYIDGNHEYPYVKQDIDNYYPKVKQYGVLGGHDFNVDSMGVIKAVTQFVVRNDLELMVQNDDWWVRKDGYNRDVRRT